MSYGVTITGNNSQLIIDGTSATSSEFLTPGPVLAQSGFFSYNKEDTIIFMQLEQPVTSSTLLRADNTILNTNGITFHQTTRFFTVSRTSVLGNTSFSNETYGMEITNSNNDITFSTRAISSVGFNIIKVFDSFTLGHGDTVHSATDLSNIFVCSGFMQSPNNFGYAIGCFLFSGADIKFSSTVPGPFGSQVLPNFGSVAVVELRT